MNSKKSMLIGLFTVILIITATAFIACEFRNTNPERALRNFSRQVEYGNLGDMTLTIYYIPYGVFTNPMHVEELLHEWHVGDFVNKIIVIGEHLEEHINLFKQLSIDDLIRVENEFFPGIRLYYVFEDSRGHEILGVAMWPTHNIFINGVEFEWNDIFSDVIKPFLPESELVEWWRFIIPQ